MVSTEGPAMAMAMATQPLCGPSLPGWGERPFCLDYTASCSHDIRAAKVLTGLSFKLPINLSAPLPAE